MEFIYLNRDNTIDLGLVLDGDPQEANVPTRYLLELVNELGVKQTIDSDIFAAGFITTVSERVFGQVVSILKLDMGSQAIPAGKYTGTVISYDPANANGLTWPEFPITVVAA